MKNRILEDMKKDDEFTQIEQYLLSSKDWFWNQIKEDMNYKPTLSGYTTTRNCIEQDYPWKSSIKSLLEICDEVVVVDGGSTDGTFEQLILWSETESKLKVFQEKMDYSSKRFAVFDGQLKAKARSYCTSLFCLQSDIDEVWRKSDKDKFLTLMKNFPHNFDLLALPFVEFWGKNGKVRTDIHCWKWRLSKNKSYITHGIPNSLRRYDENGELYAEGGTDGCDFIHSETFDPIPFLNFYSFDADQVRIKSQFDEESRKTYEQWINKAAESLPCNFHYSWYNIERKVKTYKNYWQKHWLSLFNKDVEDTAENNCFFDKSWSEVTDQEIKEIADKLENEMAGWIFHRKINWNQKTKEVRFYGELPEMIDESYKR